MKSCKRDKEFLSFRLFVCDRKNVIEFSGKFLLLGAKKEIEKCNEANVIPACFILVSC